MSGDRVKFKPIMKTYPPGSEGRIYVFTGVRDGQRHGNFDHELVDENGDFVMWADRRELRKLPGKVD